MDKMSGDDDLLVDVDIDIPTSVAAAQGWIDAEPKAAEPEKKREPEKPAVAAVDPELEAARREAQEAQARLDALSRSAAEDRVARLKAQEDAQRNQAYALNAHLARVSAHHDQMVSAIHQWETHAEMAKQQMAAAAEQGDWAKHADMQRQIAKSEATIAQLEAGKAGAQQEIEQAKRAREAALLAAQEERARPEPERKEETRQITPDEYIDKVRGVLGTHGAEWLKSHKEFVTDQRLNKRMQVFVEDWVDRHGESALRTEALVKALDERFGFAKAAPEPKREPEEDADVSDQEEETPRRQPAAPVSRSSSIKPGVQINSKGTKVRLSPDEASTAIHMYPDLTPQEAQKKYATNKARLLADGRL